MKICQVVAHYVPAYRYGGVLQVVHAVSKTLVSQGHTVHVCTTNLKDPVHNLDVPLNRPVDVDGVSVYYTPITFSRYWGGSTSLARRIWTEAKWADVLFIHFHYQFASFIGSWVARLLSKPYILFSHGSLNRYSVNARSTFRKRCYLNLLERGNFRNALFTAYHSPEEMENSYQFGKGRVVPNGIDPKAFRNTPACGYFREQYPDIGDRLIYLYLGRLDAGKGLDLLLPAFKQLLAENPKTHLVLAGSDERGYEKIVRDTIHELGIAHHVTLPGLISNQDKLGALQDADVYVLPSRGEGLSIAMLEAMHMGLPVVVSDRVGLWRQILEKDAGFVVPLDCEKLAYALSEMALDQKRARAMGINGRQLVHTCYTWDVISQQLIRLVEDTIS